jgi:hypothetical protein
MFDPEGPVEEAPLDVLARAWERRQRALGALMAASARHVRGPTPQTQAALDEARREDREADAAHTRLIHEAKRRGLLTPAGLACEPVHVVALTRGEIEALITAADEQNPHLPAGKRRADLRNAFSKLVESRKLAEAHEKTNG